MPIRVTIADKKLLETVMARFEHNLVKLMLLL
jgi:hypothetical protein